MFASHHWPTWDTERIVTFLTQQRDLYAYLHDQTLRMMNQGLTGIEIAEEITLPPALDDAWHARGYYGSVSHNVKAIYQRYLGWYDGHPTLLWQHPPQAQATRYVQAFGGIDVVLAKARSFAEAGDLRFAAELLKHAVFTDPEPQDHHRPGPHIHAEQDAAARPARRHGLDGIDHAGDADTLQRLLGLLDSPYPAFAIITP